MSVTGSVWVLVESFAALANPKEFEILDYRVDDDAPKEFRPYLLKYLLAASQCRIYDQLQV
jgi:hypothetical protein